MVISRYLEGAISQDLGSKMVLVAGPRQVGKTTLAREILKRNAGGLT
jgi:predicted AAA+ superfamily ATPase